MPMKFVAHSYICEEMGFENQTHSQSDTVFYFFKYVRMSIE